MSDGFLDEFVDGGVENIFVDILTEELTPEDRKLMAANLLDWLTTKARKKNVPDLDKRLMLWSQKFEKLAENCQFKIKDQEVRVIAADRDSATLNALKNGTDWFDPCADVVSVMISAMLKS